MIPKTHFIALLDSANKKAHKRALTFARLSPTAVEVWGDEAGYHVTYAPEGGTGFEGAAMVPAAALKKALRAAGRREVGITAGVPTTIATFGSTSLSILARTPADGPEAAALPAGTEAWALDPADFGKGGAVREVALTASRDEREAHIYAVHLGDIATATNSYAMTQRPMRAPGPGVLVPPPAVQALLRLVAATRPTALELVRGDDRAAWFRATFPGGTWMLWTQLPDATPPAYAEVTAGATTTITVDGSDLAELWRPFQDARLAIYADGRLVAWGDDVGIGTTIEAYPDGAPVVVLGAVTLRRLPRRVGPVYIEIGAGFVKVGADAVAPCDIAKGAGPLADGLPEAVQEDLALALGAAQPIPSPVRAPVELTEALAKAVQDLLGASSTTQLGSKLQFGAAGVDTVQALIAEGKIIPTMRVGGTSYELAPAGRPAGPAAMAGPAARPAHGTLVKAGGAPRVAAPARAQSRSAPWQSAAVAV